MLPLHMVFYLWVSSCVFLKLCTAQDIECTVTQDGGRTLYSVPEFEATGCYYQWLNITNKVLANHGPRTDDQVVMKSRCTLLTYNCSKRIHYNRDCISEGMKRTATCTTNCSFTANCSGNAGLQNREIQTKIHHNHWVGPTAACAAVLLLLLLLLGFLCYKFWDQIRRKIACLYTPVKNQDNVADVEIQNG